MRLEAVQTVMMTVHHRLPAGMSFSRSSSCLYIEVKGMIVCFSLLLTRGGCLSPCRERPSVKSRTEAVGKKQPEPDAEDDATR